MGKAPRGVGGGLSREAELRRSDGAPQSKIRLEGVANGDEAF